MRAMPYIHEVEVLPADIDRLDHASNQVYLRWVLEAALAHSTALGLDEDAYFRRGQAWVVRRHELTYLKPALAGDRLRVETRVASMAAATSVRRTRIVRPNDGAILFEAATDWVYVELSRGRPARIPEDVRSRFPIEPSD
ncbi:MAG: acyl-CoA thioesterase [Deltaproteobacteria bacterium]|nr:MAG: acyl-CoA thioesterase [Deltaproteobacteria bacterium]